MAEARPLLIFDSGIGGLSVLKPIAKLLPNAPIVYVADSAFYPYGTKSEAEIADRLPTVLGQLAARYDPELIVIACNTASTIALDAVREALKLPVVGTVPAIKPAAALSASRVIGVLGTEATVRQPYVDRLAKEFASDCTILRHGSARLVDLAEAKLRGEPTQLEEFRSILHGLLDQPGGAEMDVIVLACTHFPLVEQELKAAARRPMQFGDGKEGIARRTAWLTRGRAWPAAPSPGIAVFTRWDQSFESYRPCLAAWGLERIETL
jgi:glutamate racemase